MRAWTVTTGEGARLVDDFPDAELGDGDVLVAVDYTSINYKDGLALAGNPGVAKISPLIPGIDSVGTVVESGNPEWKPGDAVILTGWGVGETHHGGFAERIRVSADWLVALPRGMDPRRAAAIGTAGLTAMLCVLEVGSTEDPVLVTGAAGGVGSVAIALLAGRGRQVVAATGRVSESAYLRDLGAGEIIDRAEFAEPGKPLMAQRWGAAVDSVGGQTLANVLAQTKYGGRVAACGLAGGSGLPTTVLPFILRGVALIGVDSVQCSRERRTEAWKLLAAELDPGRLDAMTTTVGLAEAAEVGARILAGQTRGRVVVAVHE